MDDEGTIDCVGGIFESVMMMMCLFLFVEGCVDESESMFITCVFSVNLLHHRGNGAFVVWR